MNLTTIRTRLRHAATGLLGKATTYAQTNQPGRVAAVVATGLATSSSKKSRTSKNEHPDERISGITAANQAAGVPDHTHEDILGTGQRTNGVYAAAVAAGIPRH
ncbi:hypothetical protein ACGE24_06165 [Corynebacterium kroppenstedtii]|uniref:hypothetical protein n=1 Tax=Corynebacterium sp. PCR 32 TaxID=3351342 RepID=UPI0030A742AE